MGSVDQEEMAVIIDGQPMTQEQAKALVRERVEKLHGEFVKMRDRWVQHRAASGVETRWRKASDLYLGGQEGRSSNFEETLKSGPAPRGKAKQKRSTIVVNIVRPKVDQAVARICEILLPTDDKNWGIKPTPDPQLAQFTGDTRPTIDRATGQPTGMTAHDEAQLVREAARQMADGMERKIDDALTECSYNGQSRKIIEDGVRLGTGVIWGPFPARQTSKVWVPRPDGTAEMHYNEDVVPASEWVDPWDVFFDPACGNDHQRGRGVFRRRKVTRKEIRRLVGLPGYDADALRSVLRTEPRAVRVAEGRVQRETLQDDSYEMWEYHGEVEPDDMALLSSSMEGDPLEAESGVLVMINDVIVGALDQFTVDGSLPCDVWCWRKSDDSPYGYGLPDELENQQRVVNAAWRQVMDNAAVTMGGQIVTKKGQVVPMDGNYEISPLKIWYAKDDLADIRQAFGVFEFNSHLEELLAIAKTAMEMADVESSMPQIMGGEQGSAPETVGGMVMLFQNASAVLRQRVKLYDDSITRPHVGRYYDWFMANDDDPNIKGDYEVDARGSTSLLERDIQNQALLNLAAVTSNPRYAPHLKEREELKLILRAFRVNPEELLKDEQQVAQEQANNPPQDPRMVAAQVNMQAKQLDIQDRQEQRQFEAQRNDQELGFKREQLQYNSAREQAEYELAQTESAITRDATLLKLQQTAQLSRESAAAKERLETLKIENQRQIFNAEADMKMRTGQGI